MKNFSNKKKSLLTVLSLLVALCIVFVGFTTYTAKATEENLEPVTLSTEMDAVAQMRLDDPTGMRFIVNVDAEDIALFNAENVKVVVMITQENLLTDAGLTAASFDKDSDVKKAEIEFLASELPDAVDGNIKLTATILEVQDVNIAKTYVAKAYITDGAKIGYVADAVSASIYEVANFWIDSGIYADDEKALPVLNKYAKSVSVTVNGGEPIKIAYNDTLINNVDKLNLKDCMSIATVQANGVDVDVNANVTTDLDLTITFNYNHNWVDGVCDSCSAICEHDWVNDTCAICAKTCTVNNASYDADYVKRTDGAIAFDLTKLTGFSGTVTQVNVGSEKFAFVQDGNTLTVSGLTAYNVTEFVVYTADAGYKFSTLVVTHTASDLDTFKAWLGGDRNNTYIILTANIAFPDEEVYNTAGPSNFTLDGQGNKISGWVESVGIFRYGGTNITIKNITLENVKATSTIFGHSWKGDCLIENVTLSANMTSGASNRLFFYGASNLNATIKNSTFNINVDSTKINNTMYIAVSGSTVDSTNNYVFDNSVITSKGIVGECTSNYTFINGSYVSDKNISTTNVTYGEKYVMRADGKVTLDLTKFTPALVLDDVVSFKVDGVESTYEVDGNNLIVNTNNAGSKDFAFGVIVNGRLCNTVAKITIATHTAGDLTEFNAWFKGDRNNTCLILTDDITFPSTENYNGASPTNFTLDGQGHTIDGWYESMGFFRYGGTGIAIRNVNFVNIKTVDEIFGNSWKGTCYIENVNFSGYFTGSAKQEALLLDDCKEFVLYVNDCTFDVTISDSCINTTYYLVTKWSSTYPHPAETSGKIYFNNTTYTTNGIVGTHGDNFVFNNSNIRDKDDIITTTATYEDEYIALADGKVTVDLAKVSEEIVASKITKVTVAGVSSVYEVSNNNLVITTSAFGENKAIEITVDNGDTVDVITINVIIANFVLTDETSFKAWITAGPTAAGGKYAVVANNIILTADAELDAASFGGWTLNGLGNTVTNVYDYSGMLQGGAGNITMKNITLNMKTCYSAFGDDWYGTNNFINVTIKVTVPGHAGTSRLLFDRVRENTIFNFTDCTFTFNVDSGLQANSMALMKLENSGIVVNFVNTDITSTGTIDAIVSNYVLDANSSITDKNGVK